MPLTTMFAGAGVRGLGWGASAAAGALAGVELIKPSTVDAAGTGSSATINANGSVDFSTCTNFTLNNVFSSTYDNYMIVFRWQATTANDVNWIMASGGGGASTTNGYVTQNLSVTGSTRTTTQITQNSGLLSSLGSISNPGAFTAYVYGPFLAQPTVIKTITNTGTNAAIIDRASTHNQSVSYDGIRIFPASGNFTGTVSVYGLVN